MNLLSVAYNIVKNNGGKLPLMSLTGLLRSSDELEFESIDKITNEFVANLINLHGRNIWLDNEEVKVRDKVVQSIYSLFNQLTDAFRKEITNPEELALILIFYKRITDAKEYYSQTRSLDILDLAVIARKHDSQATLIEELQKLNHVSIFNHSIDNLILKLGELSELYIKLALTRSLTDDFSLKAYSVNEFALQFEKLILRTEKLRSLNNELPDFIRELIVSIVNRNPCEVIYDPYFNSPSLFSRIQETTKQPVWFFAEGVPAKSLVHKNMSLYLYGVSADLYTSNALQQSITKPDQFNLIICHPPLGLKLTGEIPESAKNYLRFGHSNDSTNVYIQLILSRLNRNGRAIIVVTDSFLFSADKVTQEIRKHLVEKDLLEMVISIPSGAYQSTFVRTNILVINKNKEADKKNKITFLDTKTIYATVFDESQIPGIAAETVNMIGKYEDPEVLLSVASQKVAENNYRLQVPLYVNGFIEKIENLRKQGIKIEFINRILKKSKYEFYKGDRNLKLITHKNLSRNYNEFYLDTKYLEYAIKSGGAVLKQDAVLVAKAGGKLHPTIFKYNDEPVVVDNNILVLIPDQKLINPEYLCHILEHEIVKDQLKAKMEGDSAPYISIELINTILIPLPDLKEQTANVLLSEKNVVIKLEQHLAEAAEEKKEVEYAILSALKHSFGQKPFKNYLLNIESYLTDSINNKAVINWNDKLSGHQSALTLRKTFDSLFSLVKDTSELFTNMKELFSVDSNPLHTEKTDIIELIKETKNETEGTEDIEFNYPETKCEAYVDRLLFKQLISNLITNSIKHGFNDNPEGEKIIIFDVRSNPEDREWMMNYYNNGKHFPEGYKYEDFVAFGNKGVNSLGSGIGGHLIKRIVDRHQGSFSISNIEMEGLEHLAVPVLGTDEKGQTIEVNSLISGGVKFKFIFSNIIPYE